MALKSVPPSMNTPEVLVLVLVLAGCATGQDSHDKSGEDLFFLKQIFNKYGDHGVISFEGFEHLLENLGLGRLVFDKSHSLSLHKVNGSFQEVHDSLRLHQHGHENTSASSGRNRREVQELVTSYSEPLPWTNKCLTPQDILETFGLEPHHNLVISPSVFLNICPAIIYELDQRSCYGETDEQIQTDSTATQHSAWLYASLSVLVISLIGLLGVAMVPLVQRAFYQQLLHFLVALAVGTMCGDALLHLLPHALVPASPADNHDHVTPVLRATVTFLAVGFFFVLEAFLLHLNSKPAENAQMDLRIQSSPKEQKLLTENKDGRTSMEEGTRPCCLLTARTEESVPCVRDAIHGDRRMAIREVAAQIGTSYGTCQVALTQDAEAVEASCQHGHQHWSQGSVAWMVIMGDGLHNLTDGLAVGAAFNGDTVAGFATAIAVLCHELPHELGDFAVLLQAGMSIQKAIVYNIVSSVLSFVGMAAGVWIGEYEAASMWIYAFTAGAFLYISLVDLVPEMKNASKNSRGFLDVTIQLAGIITGAGIMLVIALHEDDITSLVG
ncbi:zinc transporter ZIP6-like isoform X2 [Zootermopsis nevadensis]|uniref:zinc transporter ZIP6-like isoform X2 n=1 Tax=Zootermopsis nevadensis TaxID=136037 RepID=UPI000B8E5AEA|nr:zinc transporter ZIP6-like isoform X2 [Zootermopsis nevadensis]